MMKYFESFYTVLKAFERPSTTLEAI